MNSILTQTFLIGIAAASLIFLSAYGGMISLAQVAMYGIAGFALGNMVTQGESKGLNLGWDPWLSVVLAILITVAIGLIFGAVAARSLGIYFLMITLTYAVIVNYFFGQVTQLSGFSGISGIAKYAPDLVGGGSDPDRLYYTALILAVLVYVLIRFILRTPFGLALQGIRDDPIRMSSLGLQRAAPPNARLRASRPSSPRSPGSSTSGGTGRSTRRRSGSRTRSTSSWSP